MKEVEALLQRLVIERTEAERDRARAEARKAEAEARTAELQERYIARLMAEAVSPGKVMS